MQLHSRHDAIMTVMDDDVVVLRISCVTAVQTTIKYYLTMLAWVTSDKQLRGNNKGQQHCLDAWAAKRELRCKRRRRLVPPVQCR